MESYSFPTAPLPNPDSVVAGPQYRFTVISNIVLRYEWAHDGIFEDRASTFAINRHFPKPEFTTKETENQLEIISLLCHWWFGVVGS